MKRFAIIFVLSALSLCWTHSAQACGPCYSGLFSYKDVPLNQLLWASVFLPDTMQVSPIGYRDTLELAVGDSINTFLTVECDWIMGPSNLEYKYYRNGTLLIDAPTNISSWNSYYTITIPGTYEITHLVKSGLAKYTFEVVRPPPIEQPKAFNVQVYPNPATDMIWLDFEIPDTNDLVFYMVDITGKETSRYAVNSAAGYFTKTMNLNQLSAGMYYLVIESPEDRIIKTIVKN